MKPLISVCMPSYNQENFIREAIESVLNQTYENFELIVLDNISTDSSPEIVKSYKDPRIRFYRNEQHYNDCYSNCNKLISFAKGELIAFLHTDDIYAPEFLEEIVGAYVKNSDKKVFLSAIYKMDQGLNSLIPCFPFNSKGIKSQKEVLTNLAYENTIGNGINVVIHKDCINEIGIFDTNFKYAADYDLFMRLANKYEFVYIHKLLTYYRIHAANLTNTVYLEMVKQGHSICNKNFENSKIISEDLKKELLANQWNSLILKAFYMGLKFRSKELTRDLIGFYCRTYPELSHHEKDYAYFLPVLDIILKTWIAKPATGLLLRLGKLYRNHTAKNTRKIFMENFPEPKHSMI